MSERDVFMLAIGALIGCMLWVAVNLSGNEHRYFFPPQYHTEARYQ